MNNDAAVPSPAISEGEIRAALERWKSRGIIVENTVGNLFQPTETKSPLASHILGDGNFLRQIADYREQRGDAEPVAIEFIRWDDAYSRIVSALSSDDTEVAPDVAQVGLPWAVGLANQGRVADVSGEIDDSIFFPPQMVGSEAFDREGLFAVPWFSEMRLLYYDRAAVSSADALADWGSFLSTCEDYTKRTGKPFIAFPTTITWNLLHNIAPWLWAGGGDIVRETKVGPWTLPRVALDSPESLRGLLFLKKLSESGCASFPNTSQEITDRMLLDGDVAAVITGPWITSLAGPSWKERYGAVSPPAGPGGSQPFVGGSHLVVSEASRARGNFDRAVDFVRFLTSTKSQAEFNRMSGFYPVNREALDAFLASDRDGLFRKTVERGLTYPAMSDWGEIVENEFIGSDLWHIWRDIAQGVSDETLMATVKNAADSLRSKLVMSRARRAAPSAGITLALLAAAGVAVTLRSRRKLDAANRRCDGMSAELARIGAERAVLEGKALLLTRRGEEQSDELGRLEEKLAALNLRAEVLTKELVSLAPKRAGDERKIGPVSIGWDGQLAIRGERVRFENNRQARRLLEHLLRDARAGQGSLNCLWGYALFGWKPDEIQSHPQRLFEIMAAKINAQLKAKGAPPIVVKAARGSYAWKLGWDKKLVLESSDVVRSAVETENASCLFAEGSAESAYAHAIAALELDPKNLDALAMIADALSAPGIAKSAGARMESMLTISRGIVAGDLEALQGGIASVEWMAASGKLPKGIEREDLEEELARMRGAEAYLIGRIASASRSAGGAKRSAVLTEILQRIGDARQEIASLKAAGASDETLWAQVAGGQVFSQLLAVPPVGSLVGNFYNEEMRAKEDPRLVQLALISMLSQERPPIGLNEAGNERDVIAAMRKGLSKEIGALTDSIASMS